MHRGVEAVSLSDDDLSPLQAHRMDREAAEPDWVRMARKQRAEEHAARKAASDELAAVEDPAAEEARWSRLFTHQAADLDESRAVYSGKPGIDRRCFGGDVA